MPEWLKRMYFFFFSISAAHVFKLITLIRAVWLSRRKRKREKNVIIILRTRYLESLLKVYSFSTISPEHCHKAERFSWCCCRSSPQGGRVTCQPTLTSWNLLATQKLCKFMVSKHLKEKAGQPFERQDISWRQLEDQRQKSFS